MKLTQSTRGLVVGALALVLFAVSAPLRAQLDFGDDSSRYANDGECDDPRFEGPGAADELLESDRGHDATDCRERYEAGEITLRADAINYGDDASRYAKDGECDDPRFQGAGSASELVEADRGHDATDCRELLATGRVTLRSDSGGSPGASSTPPAEDAVSREQRLAALIADSTFAAPERLPQVTGDELREAFWVKTRDALRECGEGQSASRSACLDRVAGGLGAGAIDQRAPQNGWSHLSQAAAKGDAALIEALVEHGANVNLAADDGLTPLHLAIVVHDVAVVRFLVEHGADVNAKTNAGMSAMVMALAYENEEINEILREAGALY
jgi:hypothetical protein